MSGEQTVVTHIPEKNWSDTEIESILNMFESEVLADHVRMSSSEFLESFRLLLEKLPFYARTKRALMSAAEEMFSSPNFYGYNPNMVIPLLYTETNLLLVYPSIAKSDARNPHFILLMSILQKHARVIITRTLGNDRERKLQNKRTIEKIQDFLNKEDDMKKKRGFQLPGGNN